LPEKGCMYQIYNGFMILPMPFAKSSAEGFGTACRRSLSQGFSKDYPRCNAPTQTHHLRSGI